MCLDLPLNLCKCQVPELAKANTRLRRIRFALCLGLLEGDRLSGQAPQFVTLPKGRPLGLTGARGIKGRAPDRRQRTERTVSSTSPSGFSNSANRTLD